MLEFSHQDFTTFQNSVEKNKQSSKRFDLKHTSEQKKNRRWSAGTGIFFAQLQNFDQFLQIVKQNENCAFNLSFKSSSWLPIPLFISAILGIIELWGLWSEVRGQRYFSESTWRSKPKLLDFDSENPASTFRGNEFDQKEKPQIAFLPIPANVSTRTGKLFQKVFIKWSYIQKKLSTETSLADIQSVNLKAYGLKSQEEPHAFSSFEILSQPGFPWEQNKFRFLIWEIF